jgi:hypothetical protein
MKTKPKQLGDKPERLIFPASKEQSGRIDDYRFANRINTKSEAIRRLIDAGLEAEKKRGR